METLLHLGNAWKEPPFHILPWGFKKCGFFFKIRPFASKRNHRVFLHCFDQKEGWRLFSISELRGNFLSCSVFHEDSRNAVSSLKFIHLRQNGASVCFLTVLIKTKDGDSSPPRKCMEGTSLSHLTMRIQEMWFFLQNSSICVKKKPPCVSDLF